MTSTNSFTLWEVNASTSENFLSVEASSVGQLEAKLLLLLQQPGWLPPTTSPKRYQLPFSPPAQGFLIPSLCVCEHGACGEMLCAPMGIKGGQRRTSRGLTWSHHLQVCRSSLAPRHVVWLMSGKPEGPVFSLAWSQHCWAKGAAVWRSLGCSMSCGQVPACGIGATWSCWASGIGADSSCPCFGMVSRGLPVVLLLSLFCGFSTGSLHKRRGEARPHGVSDPSAISPGGQGAANWHLICLVILVRIPG